MYMILHAEDDIPTLPRPREVAHCSSSSNKNPLKVCSANNAECIRLSVLNFSSHALQRKRPSCNKDTNAQIGPPKTVKLDTILDKCDKEDISDSLGLEQPLFIDEESQKIKCSWCPAWVGSDTVKVANQHTRKLFPIK